MADWAVSYGVAEHHIIAEKKDPTSCDAGPFIRLIA
jgi:hypothetical protein